MLHRFSRTLRLACGAPVVRGERVPRALDVTGVNGIVASSVRQRTAEIGVRMALGATSGVVVRAMVRQTGGIAAAGVGLGRRRGAPPLPPPGSFLGN